MLFSLQRRRESRGIISFIAAERAANINPQPLRGVVGILNKGERYPIDLILLCPQGFCFSLSGLSVESEKKKLLCELCVSSAAGGETMQSTKNQTNYDLQPHQTSQNRMT